jgi:hypothetical protein
VGLGVGGDVVYGVGVGADIGGSVDASEGRNVGAGMLVLFDFRATTSSKSEIQRRHKVVGKNKLYAAIEFNW